MARPLIIYNPRDQLPRRARFRLWRHRQIDNAACWLIERHHIGAGVWVWKIFRMWDR